MLTRINQFAIFEGKPWYVFPEKPSQELPPLTVGHWQNGKFPLFLTDYEKNGYVVLTENGDPLTAKGWECMPANLPEGWTYSDGQWKLVLVNVRADGIATIFGMRLF